MPDHLSPDALAIRLRRELGITERRFDLLELARSMGFEVRYEPIRGGAEGLSARVGSRDVILVNSDGRSLRRQRFTLAHEAGHSLLGHPSNCRPHHVHGHSREPEEAAANQFAAALLMPLSMFRADIQGVHPRMDELSSLADIYGVSRTAATLRFVRFTKDNCAVLGVTPETSWLFKGQCLHRPKLASDSDPIRTPVPIESGQ